MDLRRRINMAMTKMPSTAKVYARTITLTAKGALEGYHVIYIPESWFKKRGGRWCLAPTRVKQSGKDTTASTSYESRT